MAGNTAILAIKIIADAAGATKGLDDTASTASRMGAGLKSAALPAAALVASLAVMGKAAAEDAQGQAVLAQQLQNTTGATQAQLQATEDFIAKTALATGVADDQLRPAFAALARGTGDLTTAQKAMNVALDVAAATGKPVEQVSDAIAKGYGGQMTALGKLVPGMDKAVLAGGDMNTVMAELQRLTGGASAAAADSAAGKMQRLSVAMDETKESIGAALLPALESVLPLISKLAEFVQRNASVVGPLVVILGALAVVIWAVNAAMAANPVVWIIIAIAALVAIIVIAYQKSETFRDIVQGTWNAIKVAALFVWENVLKPIFGFIIDYYSMLWSAAKIAAGFIVDAWNAIKSGVSAAWGWLKSTVFDPWVQAFQLLWSAAMTARDKVVEVWNSIKNAISNAWDGIKAIFDKFTAGLEKIQEWLGKIKIPDWMHNIPGISSLLAAPSTVAVTAPAVGPMARRSAPLDPAGRRSGATGVQVNVYLDGMKVGGLVDRIVTRRLDDEGARMAAGAWGV